MPILILMLLPAVARGQEAPSRSYAGYEHEPGDSTVSLGVGLNIPLFFINPSQGSAAASNLSLGGTGSLHLDIFFNRWMSIGIGLDGAFAATPNDRSLFLVPIVARYTIYPVLYPFEFPIYLDAGINFSTFAESTKADPIIKLGFGVFFTINPEWSVGITSDYWFIPQIYPALFTAPPPEPEESRIGNFVSIMLGARYNIR